MSAYTNILENIRTEIVTLVSGLETAQTTFGAQQVSAMSDDDFPHLMLHTVNQTNTELDFQQVERQYDVTCDLWFRITTEAAARAALDTLLNGWNAVSTLSGIVERSFISSIDFAHPLPDRSEKVARIIVTAFETENQ